MPDLASTLLRLFGGSVFMLAEYTCGMTMVTSFKGTMRDLDHGTYGTLRQWRHHPVGL